MHFTAALALFLICLQVSGVDFQVDINTEIGPMPLLGYNITYARNGQLIVDNAGNLQTGRLGSLQAVAPRWLRYPGGTISNTYDWKRAIGPQAQREDQVHAFLNRLDPEPSTFGPDEAAQFMETVDGELVMVISWNSTAADAADLVEYMNAEVGENPNGGIDWAAVRSANGHPEPYGVRYWEIGNEGGGRDIATWTSWPYDGDDIQNDGVSQGTATARQWWADGGTKVFTNQLAALRSIWNESGVKTSGFPGEVFYAKFPPVVPDSLTLSVGTSPLSAQTWTRVVDLTGSGSGDQHYTLDDQTGRIEFGDGVNGSLLPSLENIYLNYTTGPRDGMRQFYNAMKAVDPTIRIGAGNFNLKQSRQVDPTLPYDGWQAHGGFFLGSTNPVNSDPFWELVARGLGTMPDESDREWTGLAAFGDVQLFISEYTSLGNLFNGGIQYAHTIAGALHHALFIRETALSQRAALMGPNYLYNNLQTNVVHVDDNNVVSAQGWAYAMYNRFFGSTLLDVTFLGTTDELTLPFSTKGGGTGSVTFPVLMPLASRSDEGTIYLMLINTSKETSYPVTADFGTPVFPSSLHILDADSLTAVNSASTPFAVDIRTGDAPVSVNSTTVSCTVPPASVSVVVVSQNTFPGTSEDVILAGFDRFDDPFTGDQTTDAAIVYPGVTATLTISGVGNSEWFRANTGSNDGTFGPSTTGADNTQTTAAFGSLTTVAMNDQDAFYLEIAISNNSGANLVLNSVVFDSWRDFNGSPPRWDLEIMSGDLTVGYVGQTAFIDQMSLSPASLNANDYPDFDLTSPVSALPDRTLKDGESATLQLQVWESDFTRGTTGKISIDNIALLASAVRPDLPIATIQIASGSFPEISFLSKSGLLYQLQKSTTLQPGSWSDVVGQSVTGDGLSKILLDPDALATGESAFYRLDVSFAP